MPQLFGYLDRRRNPGLIPVWDVVAFDEVAGLDISDPTAIQMLKDYMESGSFSRGRDETPADASMIYLGNTGLPPDALIKTSHLFADLPAVMIDTAFLDRLHFYLPGWEVPKMEQRFFTNHYGLVSDYLSEALRELRKQHGYADAITQEFTFGPHLNARDEKAVRKTVSGLLKLLHPDEQWTRAELREYLEFALEGRRRVKEQLKVLAPHEFARVSFSYVDIDTGREIFVGTLEKPEYVDLAELDKLEGEEERVLDNSVEVSISELVKLPESQTLEFKSSMRRDLNTHGVSRALEQVIVKSIAGLMNAHGGVLLIGVADNGEILGIESDMQMLPRRKDIDSYENHLVTLLESGLGAAPTANTRIQFEQVDSNTVCRVVVRRASSPVWTKIKGQDDVFYVRLGNSTRPLGPRAAYDYISQHFT